ncbi:TetR/AcrR family transcriptional regulator [Cyanobium sp. ATX 6F1]|uniref:TetR/AcrR family transcriptional regulator n=1 Tax=unclassified Cyanobium TaxID=2627006 RepID=UPI0020CC9EEC|nr:TetR/AcrR family transcriptional regulator [Cyanobium sp. ATX 6F1]MCP9915287.1 TetR/AcrR family transcriptional regulator [Cyanobium sp. ATX 6F1]
MRYPEGHNQAVRERILSSAAEELRRNGLSGIGIPALMKRAGLTHGAFYSHFPNREALVAEAIRAAAAASADGPLAGSSTLEQSLAQYLSPEHLAHPERGCVIAALGGEGARQPAPVRSAFAAAARGLLTAIERKLHPRRPSRLPSDQALRLVSTMVGAVVLARLVDDPALAQRLLEVAAHSAEPSPGRA